jgi:hypothetical protein
MLLVLLDVVGKCRKAGETTFGAELRDWPPKPPK